MRLKDYQEKVIADLSRYMELLNLTGNMGQAYSDFWNEKGVPVGAGEMPAYQNILPGVPDLCMKVPTGGGKTFLACNAVKVIFDQLPPTKTKTVVWLVPSESILSQTLAAFRNHSHAYRQKLDADFGGRVEIYTKDELLAGQNFNMGSIQEQLSVMVLSYDSFRGRKEVLKSKQENSSLAPLAAALGSPEHPIPGTDETALIQVINQLSPLVIVDESHHARSTLSKEMLRNFNPCFVLDLTATPTKESNVISYVDAIQLKKEDMVKLPVIVYNRYNQNEVLADACDLRNQLEKEASAEERQTGKYIRPIVLFQAQPRGKEDSQTFEKLKTKLVDAGIPAEQIAIKTADINELKNVNLIARDCPIRYIITVNALKEGWDCPFAYILASLANKNSQVDVEQIVGRILRQPYTHRFRTAALNMSYVLTSSDDFRKTLENVVLGLNGAGFSDKDYRVGNAEPEEEAYRTEGKYEQGEFHFEGEGTGAKQEQPTDSGAVPGDADPGEDFLNFDSKQLGQELEERGSLGRETGDRNTEGTSAEDAGANHEALNNAGSRVTQMLQDAEEEQRLFDSAREAAGNDSGEESSEVREKMNEFHANPEFEQDIQDVRIPEFYLKVQSSFFVDGYEVKLSKENLTEDFTLKGKPYDIQFEHADDEMARIDVNDQSGSVPKVFKMSEADQRYIKEQIPKMPPEKQIKTYEEILIKRVDKINAVNGEELQRYVDLVVKSMDKDDLQGLAKAPLGYAERIRKYVIGLLEIYREQQFYRWIETGKITCKPSYKLPEVINPVRYTSSFGRSLYQAEDQVDGFEYRMVLALTGMENVRWWHRNISGHGFRLNGFINHDPDFIVRMKSGKILLIETKGDHLENRESKQKLALGRKWQEMAGQDYRYYMVFEDKNLNLPGAYQFDQFLGLMKEM